MPKIATALSALLVLCVLALAACGGSGSSSSTKTATLPSGTLGAATASPRLGYYAGMECVDHACSHFTPGFARNQVVASCKAGKPVPGRPSSFPYQGYDEYFVCFDLRTAGTLVDFYVAGRLVVQGAPVEAGRFPQTCENGWCVSGAWTAARRLHGAVRNPNGLTTQYAAEWVGGP